MQFATEDVLVPEATSTRTAAGHQGGARGKTLDELSDIVSRFASSHGWMDRVRLRIEDRWYERLHHDADYDIWAISWMPGQSTGFHDHGESSGAFVVATGVLEEHRPGEQVVVLPPGEPRVFGPDYAHDVRNVSVAPAVSIHAYSPPLNEMNEYEFEEGLLVPREHASERAGSLNQEWRAPATQSERPIRNTSIEQVLSAARARLRRFSPEEAYLAAAGNKAVLVDIRPESQREIEGSIPGALIVERNVLEWRLDPTSKVRLPIATDHDLQVIVFCSEGYTSSLAAAALQDLGLWRATDVVGGFHAWHAAGLPIVEPSTAS